MLYNNKPQNINTMKLIIIMKNMKPRVALDGRIALDCGEDLLFVEFNDYDNDKVQFTVTGENTNFTGETQKLEQGDHIAIAVLANVFETIKNAKKIITPNSLKYDIDRWFKDIEVIRETNYFDKPSVNNTDYNFPDMWGILLNRIDDDDDPLTKEEADEMMSDWFTTRRVLWHMKLQKDAGMWDQWTDEKLEQGMSMMDAWRKSNSNQYRKK